MRVLVTVPSLAPEYGGPAAKALQLRAALRSLGTEVELVGCGEEGLPVLMRFHGTPVPRKLGPLLRAVRRSDVVHVLGYRDPVGSAAALGARRARVPYVLEPVGMHRRRLRSLGLKGAFDATIGRAVVRGAAAVVATSDLEARELLADGVDPRRVHVRPNGVDVDGLLPLSPRGSLRRRLGIPPDAPLVLALGRITAKKGLLGLAQALERLPSVWALVAGPDDGDGTLQALLEARRRRSLDERLVLHGGLWGSDKAQALADADAFCLPSATENFGNAAAEAAAVGLPVVVSDRCGVAEFLDPQASRVTPYGDVAALARAIREVTTPGVRRAARLAASLVREALDWQTLAGRQLEIYREAGM